MASPSTVVLEPYRGVDGYVCLVPAYGIVLAYLASEDDHLVDSSGSLFAQELADDVVAERAGTDNGEVLVSRHVLLILGATRVLPPAFMRFLVSTIASLAWAAINFSPIVVTLTLTYDGGACLESKTW